MANEKPEPTGQHTSINKSVWIAEARKYPEYFHMVEELLDRGMGRSLNGKQLYIESSAILACLLLQTDKFTGMPDAEIKKYIIVFLQIYWSVRDEEKYPGINHAESPSGRFERDFLTIASLVFNRVIRRNILPPNPKVYFKESK